MGERRSPPLQIGLEVGAGVGAAAVHDEAVAVGGDLPRGVAADSIRGPDWEGGGGTERIHRSGGWCRDLLVSWLRGKTGATGAIPKRLCQSAPRERPRVTGRGTYPVTKNTRGDGAVDSAQLTCAITENRSAAPIIAVVFGRRAVS